ncbi:NrsF family protein [Paracoccus salsus]|uniref:NrsF family protein n=1 Tax=Paracoccus salsus TaxID=2911061 RepID=UPI001F1A89E1|nr:DUF1109 domain-containing protein [Paracoccus salsus]MCF3973166.1 DUF1109 domain-containing protein [Paracoccus salsus]
MRTDDLVALLGADDTPPRPIAPRLMAHAGVGLAGSAAVALGVLGIRPDLLAALADPVTLMKWVLPLAAALPALRAALRLARPQVRSAPAQWLSVTVALMAMLWLVLAAVSAPPGALWPQIRGSTALICLTSVTLVGIVPLVVGLRILSEGASTAPARSGALLGLASGGLAAAIYALHCDEDAPLFFLTWYSLGIMIVTALGALMARRMLRW